MGGWVVVVVVGGVCVWVGWVGGWVGGSVGGCGAWDGGGAWKLVGGCGAGWGVGECGVGGVGVRRASCLTTLQQHNSCISSCERRMRHPSMWQQIWVYGERGGGEGVGSGLTSAPHRGEVRARASEADACQGMSSVVLAALVAVQSRYGMVRYLFLQQAPHGMPAGTMRLSSHKQAGRQAGTPPHAKQGSHPPAAPQLAHFPKASQPPSGHSRCGQGASQPRCLQTAYACSARCTSGRRSSARCSFVRSPPLVCSFKN